MSINCNAPDYFICNMECKSAKPCGYYYKEKQMSKDKMDMPTKEQILETAKSCPQAKDALVKLFPKAFDDDRVNLIKECTLEMRADLCILYDNKFVGVVRDIGYPSSPGRFKVTYRDDGRLNGIYMEKK